MQLWTNCLLQVRDRATLYLKTLGAEGSVVENEEDVQEILFGSLDLPLSNLETSLKNYVRCFNLVFLNLVTTVTISSHCIWAQEPSEEPFDLDSVSKEIKSQPLAEKKGSGKKSKGLGVPPTTLTSSVDAYEKMLRSIEEFSDFGKLFKVLPFALFINRSIQILIC